MKIQISKILAIVIISLVSAGSAMGDDQDHEPQLPQPHCEIILDHLTPCLPYILENEAKPAQDCCDAVMDLRHYSNDKEGQQNICECVKAAAILMGAPIDDFSKVSSLPTTCGLSSVKLPPISSDIDCSRVD